MSQLLIQREVLPLYGQVAVFDSKAIEFPEWVTGEEDAVANAGVVMVATQSDATGYVAVCVSDGLAADLANVVFAGSLQIDSAVLHVGSIVAGDVFDVCLKRPGAVQVVIAVDRIPSLQRVSIYVEQGWIQS